MLLSLNVTKRSSKYRIKIIRIGNSRVVFPDESAGFMGDYFIATLLTMCALD
jgi:hypothetical protein